MFILFAWGHSFAHCHSRALYFEESPCTSARPQLTASGGEASLGPAAWSQAPPAGAAQPVQETRLETTAHLGAHANCVTDATDQTHSTQTQKHTTRTKQTQQASKQINKLITELRTSSQTNELPQQRTIKQTKTNQETRKGTSNRGTGSNEQTHTYTDT